MDAELISASNEYPLDILLTELATPKTIIIMYFQVFIVFGVVEFVKSIQSGYSLNAEFNSASNELS